MSSRRSSRNKTNNADNTNAAAAAALPINHVNDGDEEKNSDAESSASSSSSSDERIGSASSKGDWKIDLSTFSKTRMKLETELNSSSKVGELLDAYFTKQHTALSRLPWDDKRPEYGIFPLHRYFYQPCKPNEPGATMGIAPDLFVKLTDGGRAIIEELSTTNSDYYEANIYSWGETKGKCIPTYSQMLRHPKQALNAFRRYLDNCPANAISHREKKKLIKRSKRWIKANHLIWSTIVSHLDTTSSHVCSGLEMSNGIMLFSTLIVKFSHKHAQSLAALLRELTNLTLRKTDPDTGKFETVQKFMDRARNIGREAAKYPQMTVPIAMPLMKVFALEGLMRSDSKYSTMVTTAYNDNLEDSFEHLTSKMQTVEGMRAKQIQDEFGSSTATNLNSASVQTATGSGHAKGRAPNDPCHLKGHFGHTNGDCSLQKLKKLKDSGRAAKIMYDLNGRKLCEFVTNRIKCPFKRCNQSHKSRGATTKRVNHTDRHGTTTSDESTDDHHHKRRKHRRDRDRDRKKKASKHKRKHKKHRRVTVARTTSESSESSESSSDFL